MAPSYTQVHYGLRFAKHVERKMLVEAFQRLSQFGTLNSYRYLGFGSIYFTDFILIHKVLGITKMISIEKDTNSKHRFDFNRPFRCITMKYGYSHQILPSLSWQDKSVVWLDYDGMLDGDVLGDIALVCNNVAAGSVLVVSVNAEPQVGDEDGTALEKIERMIGRDNIPENLNSDALAKWGTAKVFRQAILNSISEAIINRNWQLIPSKRLKFEPLFNFHYDDGAKMLTVGGLLYAARQQPLVNACQFDQLHFVRSGEEPYKIEIPKLTLRELHFLNSKLPEARRRQLQSLARTIAISDDALAEYAEIYRYFPTFAETEL